VGSDLFTFTGSPQNWQIDDGSWSCTLPFDFPFYGNHYRKIHVASNGFLDLIYPSTDFNNTKQLLIDNIRIAPLWDDLVISTPDDIFLNEEVPDEVTIRWQARTLGSGTSVNVAVVLFADGRIRFDYGPDNPSVTPTVGISAGNGTDYILVPGYDGESFLTNAASVLFTPIPSGPTLPAGVSLDPNMGCFSGIPVDKGAYSVIVQFGDSSLPPQVVTGTLSLYVDSPPGDLNEDCMVSLPDMGLFSLSWLREDCNADNNWCDGADWDHSRTVDLQDLVSLADHWLSRFGN
jgi:hypothetical protein